MSVQGGPSHLRGGSGRAAPSMGPQAMKGPGAWGQRVPVCKLRAPAQDAPSDAVLLQGHVSHGPKQLRDVSIRVLFGLLGFCVTSSPLANKKASL